MDTGRGLDRNAGLTQPGQVALHGTQADAEPLGQHGSRHRMQAGAEELDQQLLPLHPAQGQVVVAGCGRTNWDWYVHLHEITAISLAGLRPSVEPMTETEQATESIEDFFIRYTGYLTDGDLDGLADIYHYPALAVSAQGCLAITDPQQTRDFFRQGREFYHSRGIHHVSARNIVTDAEVHGVWVGRLVLQNLDAEGRPVDGERNAYQVVTLADGSRRIAVTTPLDA